METSYRQMPSLLKDLECPVCLEIPNAEIYNCVRGHSICKSCSERMTKCAICQGPMTAKSRNYVMEALAAEARALDSSGQTVNDTTVASRSHTFLYCSYNSDGCRAAFSRSEIRLLEDHKSHCEYRPVLCAVLSDNLCRTSNYINLSNYFDHLRLYHRIEGKKDSLGVFSKIDRVFVGLNINVHWAPYFLEYDGKVFLRYARIRNRKISWWIKVIGPDHESLKYKAEITISSPLKEPKFVQSWEVPIYPLRADDAAIHKDSNNKASIEAKEMEPSTGVYNERKVTHSWHCMIVITRK